MKKFRFLSALIFLICGGCALIRSTEQLPKDSVPPALGIVRFINRPEHFLIFEAEKAIPAGTGLMILREGRQIGTARVGTQQNRTFQTGDIQEGAPAVGDVVQPRPLVP